MEKNKYLLLFSSLGVLALVILATARDTWLKPWRKIQGTASIAGAPIDVRLRQIVVPGLRVADRCVSCHVGMAPGEADIKGPRITAAHKPVGHDPADFGCTVCHGGQSRATDQEDTHG